MRVLFQDEVLAVAGAWSWGQAVQAGLNALGVADAISRANDFVNQNSTINYGVAFAGYTQDFFDNANFGYGFCETGLDPADGPPC